MAMDNIGAAQAMAQRQNNKAIELLLGMVTGIVADAHLHDMEIKLLRSWLIENEYAASVWPGSIIAQRIEHVLADGIITEEERSHLLATLQPLAAIDFTGTGCAAPQVAGLPLQDEDHVDLRDKHICLTGEFIYGTRAACERLSVAHGAIPVSGVTRKVSFLVVGTNVSPQWAHTSYGRKIEQAMELRQDGHPIRVISERRWTEVLMTV